MNEDKQIQSMIDFIEREAHEKAEELDQAAQEEYDVEKMRLVEAEKGKIRNNAEAKKKQVEIDRRVAAANHAKSQRLRVMEDRASILEDLRAQTKQKIEALINDAGQYKTLLNDLVKQAVSALKADCNIRCRKQDEQIVKKSLGEITSWYKSKSGDSISLQISKYPLEDAEAWGGVIVESADGKIVCDNTLSYRTENCFKEQLPTVRYNLFNEKAQKI